MAVVIKKSIIHLIQLNINGANSNLRIRKCDYAYNFSPGTTNKNVTSGTVSFEIIVNAKSGELPAWLTDGKKLDAEIIFLDATMKPTREISLTDVSILEWSGSVDTTTPQEFVSVIKLSAKNMSMK